VRLKIEQDRLAKMHPSDLADILEELAPAERQALFTSLDEGTAAETLEEVQPRMQKALTDSLDSEKIADIVEEMDPAAAADFLADEDEVLQGVVPLVKILLASPDTELEKLKDDHIVSCDIHTSTRKVAEIFDKYNLRALPVVDSEKKLAGVIYAEQVIARLRA